MTAAWTADEIALVENATRAFDLSGHQARSALPGLILVVLALAACAAPTFTYDKRGTTPAQLDRDLGQCKREAFRPSRFAVWPSGRYDTDALNRCMERKGYSVRPAETR